MLCVGCWWLGPRPFVPDSRPPLGNVCISIMRSKLAKCDGQKQDATSRNFRAEREPQMLPMGKTETGHGTACTPAFLYLDANSRQGLMCDSSSSAYAERAGSKESESRSALLVEPAVAPVAVVAWSNSECLNYVPLILNLSAPLAESGGAGVYDLCAVTITLCIKDRRYDCSMAVLDDDSRRGMFRKSMSLLAGFVLIVAAVMFGPAGIGWRQGWLFFVVFWAFTILSAVYLWRMESGDLRRAKQGARGNRILGQGIDGSTSCGRFWRSS